MRFTPPVGQKLAVSHLECLFSLDLPLIHSLQIPWLPQLISSYINLDHVVNNVDSCCLIFPEFPCPKNVEATRFSDTLKNCQISGFCWRRHKAK